MASLKETRRRIGSVKNTQKITRAMKLVAAAKFARANTAVVSARPYGNAFDALVARLSASAGELDIPLMRQRAEKKSLVVVVATDRGFCGSLNSNEFKFALRKMNELTDKGVDFQCVGWGRRAGQFLKKFASDKIYSTKEKVLDAPTYENADALAQYLIADFLDEKFDRIYLVYNRFQSALSQEPQMLQLLPVVAAASAEGEQTNGDLITEPSLEDLIENLLAKQVSSRLHRCLLEGAASEHGSRMTAMDSATTNAEEVVKKLKVEYNRARQASITKELIEITSGAEAL